MSIERRRLGDGRTVYRARWRQGGRNRARTFDRRRDAEAFEAEVRRKRRLGELGLLDAGRQTLSELEEEWWTLYAEPNLARKTREMYSGIWEARLAPRLGKLRLSEITPEVIERLVLDLRAQGVGEATITKALVILQGMMRRAVIWGRIAANPVAVVDRPRGNGSRTVRPLAPSAVEAVRSRLRLRDATLVSLLAYAGLRPGEALALTWGDVRDRTILVERAAALGEVKETKTGRSRTVATLAPLATDLAEWRLASGRPPEESLVFPRRDGRPWNEQDWRNWRNRIFKPAAEATGLTKVRPYDLRHSFCSLLLAEGRSVVEVARQAGHSPTMTLSTYAHVIEELDGSERRSAEEMIRRARDGLETPSTGPAAMARNRG